MFRPRKNKSIVAIITAFVFATFAGPTLAAEPSSSGGQKPVLSAPAPSQPEAGKTTQQQPIEESYEDDTSYDGCPFSREHEKPLTG